MMSEPLVSINYYNISNRRIAAYPVTYGVPLLEGKLRETNGLGIHLPNSEIRPVQAETLETWFDGSVKWLLLDFALPLEANEQGAVTLVQGLEPVEMPGFGVQETPDALTVTTKSLAVRFSKTIYSLFDSYVADGREMMAEGSDIVVRMGSAFMPRYQNRSMSASSRKAHSASRCRSVAAIPRRTARRCSSSACATPSAPRRPAWRSPTSSPIGKRRKPG